MKPLTIHNRLDGHPSKGTVHVGITQAGTTESNSENIRSALERGLPEFVPALCSHDGTFVITGSGHSITNHLEDLKKERELNRPICAVKGTHDWMIENDLIPTFFVSVEPRARPLKQMADETIYLLASRCNPELFDQLKDHNIIVWHSWSMEKECEAWQAKSKFGVGGGPTSGMRAITLGYLMGFRKFVLYGFDSCLAPDHDTKKFTGERVGDARKVDVIVGGKRFWCNGALADQANSFQEIYTAMGDITIDCKGNGLIAEIIKQRRLRGLPA